MNRRDVITLLGGAATAWPLVARAQQPLLPVIGYLGFLFADDEYFTVPFLQGLKETGYAEGQNVAVESRPLRVPLRGGGRDRLQAPAADHEKLVQAGIGALDVSSEPFHLSRRERIVALAMRHRIPTIYSGGEYARAGGLMSYGPSSAALYVVAGDYAGRILKGEKPADLPVQEAPKVGLIINMKTAKALGLTVPPTLLAIADEVIE